MKRLIAIGCVALAAATCAFGRDTAIYNGKLTSDLNANGNAVTSLKEPSADTDAATKKYVDAATADAGKVQSVNSQTGAVVITAKDLRAVSYGDDDDVKIINGMLVQGSLIVNGGIDTTEVSAPTKVSTKKLVIDGTDVTSHFADTNNPHGVTAAQTGVSLTKGKAQVSSGGTTLYNGDGEVAIKVGDTEAKTYAASYLDFRLSRKAEATTVNGLNTDVLDLEDDVSANTSALSKKADLDTVNAYSNELATAISNATPSDYATVKANASSALSTANDNKTSISKINSAGYITQTTADASYYPKASGDAWSSYWDGDDVRVTVTNYDSVAHLPTLYLEQRTNDTASASDDTNAFRVVWREMAHWDAFLGSTWNWEDATWQGFDSWRTSLSSQLDEKADRAWGFYDSHTGKYAPDGYTSISSSNVMICAGASYQKTATATCDIWVLTADEPYEPTGVSTNGGFQIKDADGNVQFEIVKGNKRTVKAQANGVSVTNSTLYVVYNVVAAEAPTGEVCLDLAAAEWKAQTDSDCPATVEWSGESGAWVARITPTASTDKCFFKASYETGGDDYINNRAPVGMSQLVLGGTTYNLGTAVIDGHTVLTLTPAN